MDALYTAAPARVHSVMASSMVVSLVMSLMAWSTRALSLSSSVFLRMASE